MLSKVIRQQHAFKHYAQFATPSHLALLNLASPQIVHQPVRLFAVKSSSSSGSDSDSDFDAEFKDTKPQRNNRSDT